MAVRYYQGTVFGQGDKLDLEGTSKRLRKAMRGIGTDEKAIINVLSTHTNFELQMVKDHYKTAYGRILGKDFGDELSGHFGELCRCLIIKRPYFQAECLFRAMQGIGTNERTMIEILCMSSNDEIEAIKDAYKDYYKTPLEKDVKGDTSGDFKRVMISLLQANRSNDVTVDQALVEKDVKDLLKAGVKRIGTDESVFNRILVIRSIAHLQAVFEAYTNKDQQDIEATIRSEMSGHVRDAYLAIVKHVKNPPEYFAECFHQCLDGPGTDDERLIQLVVCHCEIDLQDIAEAYLQKYNIGLSRAIHDDTSGDYRKLLVRLTNVGQGHNTFEGLGKSEGQPKGQLSMSEL